MGSKVDTDLRWTRAKDGHDPRKKMDTDQDPTPEGESPIDEYLSVMLYDQ